MPLGDEQIERYSRQIILPEIGGLGQERLLAAHVLVAADAPLLEWAAVYLAAAGVGWLSLAPLCPEVQERIAGLNGDVRLGGADRGEVDVALWGVEGMRLDRLDENTPVVAIGPAGVTVAARHLAGSPCAACAAEIVGLTVAAPYRGGAEVAEVRGGVRALCHLSDSAVNLSDGLPHSLIAVTEVIKLILGIGTLLVGRRLGPGFREEAVSCLPHCRRSAS